jgi:hypothetical protein
MPNTHPSVCSTSGRGRTLPLRAHVVRALALLLAVALPSVVSAQQWAEKMFSQTKHDFGTVARGAKAEYEFEVENIFKEDVHIASVRSSCGCTTPSITKNTLKTYEKGAIVAKFNTSSFLGHRSATITVTIDKPYYAEMQLQVAGFIRSDVVFEPGVINLGQMEQGAGGEAQVKVTYAGRENWNIKDILSNNSNFEVELSEPARGRGQVVYTMTVRLKPDAPAGHINDQLTLVSDDVRNETIPLQVEGRVMSLLDVSPAALLIGAVDPGQKVTKQLVVKSKQKFKVTEVKCAAGDCFQFKLPDSDQAKTLHLIPVTFTAGDEPGQFSTKICIETDLGYKCECVASGSIRGSEPSEGVRRTTARVPR